MEKRGIGMVFVVMTALTLSGCFGVGHVVMTGYYGRKGGEGYVRQLASVKELPILPGRYQTLAVLPVRHNLKELAETGSLKEQVETGQKEVAEYLREGWPLKIEQPKDLASLVNKDKVLAIEIEIVDYNQGGDYIKTGFGEWHVMIAHVTLINAANAQPVGEANIEGRVRVKGLPIHGVAEGLDMWLQECATAELRGQVSKRHSDSKEE